jgi:hypothetical protein
MDEYRLEPHRGFARLSADLVTVSEALLSLVETSETIPQAAD